jgi:hypothetical protein
MSAVVSVNNVSLFVSYRTKAERDSRACLAIPVRVRNKAIFVDPEQWSELPQPEREYAIALGLKHATAGRPPLVYGYQARLLIFGTIFLAAATGSISVWAPISLYMALFVYPSLGRVPFGKCAVETAAVLGDRAAAVSYLSRYSEVDLRMRRALYLVRKSMGESDPFGWKTEWRQFAGALDLIFLFVTITRVSESGRLDPGPVGWLEILVLGASAYIAIMMIAYWFRWRARTHRADGAI